MADVKLKNLHKVYDKSVVAVRDFSLDIADKEFIVLVGPSGCGKSTTLRMIAGLEEISSGELYINGVLVNNKEPKDRNIAMVFQNYALYPHMTVYDNIAFGLKMRKVPRREIDKKVREAAEILEITDYLKRKPKALSGGQRQRVAIGRAIVRNPDVFLMDEPLSNLDAKLRSQMRTELIKLRRRLNTTFVYVTHDQTEAMTLGDRIVVMNDGDVMQVGTPQDVFDRPENIFVAGFIGTPQMNFLPSVLEYENGEYCFAVSGRKIFLGKGAEDSALVGRHVTVGIRPEHINICADGIPAKLDVSELMGSTVDMHLSLGDEQIEAMIPSSEAADVQKHGGEVGISFDIPKLHFFDSETGKRLELPLAGETE